MMYYFKNIENLSNLRYVIISVILIIGNVLEMYSLDYEMTRYNEDDGLTQRYITQIVEGDDGYIWIGNWGGLDRFDGYEFVNFNSKDSDIDNLPSDRVRDLVKTPEGKLLVFIDEKVFLFDTDDYKFKSLTPDEEKYAFSYRLQTKKEKSNINFSDLFEKLGVTDIAPFHSVNDKYGNMWFRSNFGIYKITSKSQRYRDYSEFVHGQVRQIFRDKQGRLWISNKEDLTVKIYDKEENLIGYLTPEGQIKKKYVAFGASVYDIYQCTDSLFYFGCKPQGLFELTETNGNFKVKNYKSDPANDFSLNCDDIYNVKSDSHGRLWIATFKGGINCMVKDDQGVKFYHNENGLPICLDQEVLYTRHLLKSDFEGKEYLLASTTRGLLCIDISSERLDNIKSYKHKQDVKREESIGCNACMYAFRDSKDRIFICTESGGVSQLMSENPLDSVLNFHNYDASLGLPSNVCLSMFEENGQLWIVSNRHLIEFSPDSVENIAIGFNGDFLGNKNLRFSDALPLKLNDKGEYLFGLQDGIINININDLKPDRTQPKIVITNMRYGDNKTADYGIGNRDTLDLKRGIRNISIHFAALDYRNPEMIEYAFKMGDSNWNYLGKNRSIILSELLPGTYSIQLRSTDSDGIWRNNIRTILINIPPFWYETRIAHIFFSVLVLIMIAMVIYIILYIKKIEQQKRNLEGYLKLSAEKSNGISIQEKNEAPILMKIQELSSDDRIISKVLAYVEEHIGDEDVCIENMAAEAAVSKTVLNHKMKSILGKTPIAFVKEVRLQKAREMIETTDLAIKEVSFRCGFSDQQYFSKCYKNRFGHAPSLGRSS